MEGNGRHSVKKNLLNNLLARLGLNYSEELNVGCFRDIQVKYKWTVQGNNMKEKKSNSSLGYTYLRTVLWTERQTAVTVCND